MSVLIIIFGVLTALAGVIILVNPDIIFNWLVKHIDNLQLHITAVLVRLLLGILLLNQAAVSRYPLAMEILGWLALIAALVLAVIGRSNFKRLMSWALSMGKPVGRIGGVAATAFGVFLIFAFV